ncbi:DUF5057 domain-containing protein [Cytobacillus spongiae]|uniref:DUF5057 domain-containing protein n=1 Tax=Cytobacillus spongiae TaxID=2901381 RepID=UPI001F281563|nr:DUF5057 domain-containing protein [Cytobacillus spongiae]UII55058.1 DUF5057 domain-containing protein [Cytobacillus spongiae]
MKKVFSSVLVLLLLVSTFLQPRTTVFADKNIPHFNPKLKILEIVDVNPQNSRIKEALGEESFEFETITMKQFVASREELDGKYDFIAITEGEYSTTKVPEKLSNNNLKDQWHNTTNVMNDMTNLKANQIIEQFIEKGQPVILERKSIDNGGLLEQNFTSYNGKDKNVIFYNGSGNSKQQDLVAHMKNFLTKSDYIPRPRFELSVIPSENKSGNQKYKPGDTLLFEINMLTSVKNKDLKAILYIDSDFNDRYEPAEMVLEQPVSSNNTTLSYSLPRGYSGIRNWKLEVIDMGTNLKDYKKDKVYFNDEMVEVNVLQVKKQSSDNTSLRSSTNMNQSYLHVPGEYKINIDVTDMDTFNKDGNRAPLYSHERINGTYDMLIFGFKDVYNSSAINTNAANSVETFIETNQSILFTHDTIFESNNNWVNYFMDDTGQKAPRTDLGKGARKASTETNKMNEGLITTYPFTLDDNIRIALTHNQYYTLDLEDEEVIPWYNIRGGTRDMYDSWNHYYTYSKGNITYSGTGHTSSGFPTEEQQLFVNTMYRAFLGSNHAPKIIVNTPKAGDVIPSHQKIEASYQIQDFDLKDNKVSTKIFVNDQLMYTEENITNGSTIVQSIPHGLPNGGDVTLRIEATDESGAKSEEIIQLKVEKIAANLEVSRSIENTQIIQVNDVKSINYLIKPRDIQGSAINQIDTDEIYVNDITYSETFPPNVDVIVPNGFQKTGTLASGYTVTTDLGRIKYTRSGDKFTAEELNFTIKVKPTDKGDFTLNTSAITYEDIATNKETATFNAITIRADYALDRVELPGNMVINKGVPKNLTLDLKLFPENAGIKDKTWSIVEGQSVVSIDPKTGVVTANTKGNATVKVTVTDMFNNVREATTYLNVRIPVETITLADVTLNVGETKGIPLTVNPEEAYSGVTITLNDPSIATVNKATKEITGLKAGTTRITVTGTKADGELITKTAAITVREILISQISVEPSSIRLDKFETFDDFTVTIEPSNATNKQLEWKSLDPTIVKVIENGVIQGVSTGTAEIEITSKDNGDARTVITVQVGSPLTGISTNPSQVSIVKGDNSKNISSFLVYHPSDVTNVTEEYYQSQNDYYVGVNSDGAISAKRLGEADILITVKDDSGKVYSAKLTVKVVESGTNTGDDDDKW